MFQRLVITDVDQYPQLHAQTKMSAIFILPEALESLVVMNAAPIRIGVYSCDSWVFNVPWSWRPSRSWRFLFDRRPGQYEVTR